VVSGFTFLNGQFWPLVLPLALALSLLLTMELRRRRSLERFCEEGSMPWLQDLAFRRGRTFSAVLLGLSMLAAFVALLRPVWSPHAVAVKGQGRDLVFMLDVSRSMLAQDAHPNRLAMAKEVIRSALEVDRADRYGLMLFAGSSSIKAPLTQDRRFILEQLELAGPNMVHQGGTLLGDALLKTLAKIIPEDQAESCDIITISDGEDLGPLPERAVAELEARGLRWIVVGIGDEQRGARIPSRDGKSFVRYGGKELWSRLDCDYLRGLTKQISKGVYYQAGLSRFDLGKVLLQLRRLWPAQDRSGEEVIEWTEGSPLCCWCALLFLLGALLSRLKWRPNSASLASLPLVMVLNAGAPELWAEAQQEASPDTSVQRAAEQQQKQATKLELDYEDCARRHALNPDDPRLTFELAELALAKEQFQEAIARFSGLADGSSEEALVIVCRYNEALAWLGLGEQNAEVFEGLDESADEDLLESLEAPETCVAFAIDILQKVVFYDPQQTRAVALLAQCWSDLHGDDGEVAQNDQGESQGESGEQQQDEAEGESEASEEEGEGEQQSDSASGSSSEEMAEGATQAYQMEQLQLPPPSLSPQAVIEQQRAAQSQRKRGSGKKAVAVEKDW
jgi:hypothetical protein